MLEKTQNLQLELQISPPLVVNIYEYNIIYITGPKYHMAIRSQLDVGYGNLVVYIQTLCGWWGGVWEREMCLHMECEAENLMRLTYTPSCGPQHCITAFSWSKLKYCRVSASSPLPVKILWCTPPPSSYSYDSALIFN